MEPCTSMVGVILATPSEFTIHFVHLLDVPSMTIESFLEYLTVWIGVEIDRDMSDTIVAGRPRCVVPTLGGAPQ